jgi:signal transduction histidine kinase
MDFVAGMSAAVAAVYVLVAAGLFALVRSRPRDPSYREYLPAAALTAALSLALAGRVAELTIAAADDAWPARLATSGLALALASVVELALTYGASASPQRLTVATRKRLRTAGRIQGGLYLALALLGVLQRPNGEVSDVGLLVYATWALPIVGLLVVLVQAYLDGRREALMLVVGASLMAAALVHDLAVSASGFNRGMLLALSAFVLVMGLAATVGVRYVTLGKALEDRSRALRRSAQELRRSYEELRLAQEELVRKEQLAVVGELAAVIAHEVRNPLAILANAVSGLRKPSISREDQATLLSIMDEESSRLNRLVTDLLRYARPVNVQRNLISLVEVVERALHQKESRETWKRPPGVEVEMAQDLSVTGPDGEPGEHRVWGDPNLLRQVFDNLIDNAFQAMGGDGVLSVKVRSVVFEGKEGLMVDVSDTGEGMDTNVRTRAKDPFFTTRPSGTGLGLAIVDRIVDAHGGHFVITSRSGEGTTASVFLPGGSEPPPAHRTPRNSSRSRSRSLGLSLPFGSVPPSGEGRILDAAQRRSSVPPSVESLESMDSGEALDSSEPAVPAKAAPAEKT